MYPQHKNTPPVEIPHLHSGIPWSIMAKRRVYKLFFLIIILCIIAWADMKYYVKSENFEAYQQTWDGRMTTFKASSTGIWLQDITRLEWIDKLHSPKSNFSFKALKSYSADNPTNLEHSAVVINDNTPYFERPSLLSQPAGYLESGKELIITEIRNNLGYSYQITGWVHLNSINLEQASEAK